MTKPNVSFKEASKMFSYNPITGYLTRLKTQGSMAPKGGIAGSKHPLGYLTIGIQGKTYYAHRIAWLLITGSWPKTMIDHINGIKDDNRLCNLREATLGQNAHNQTINVKNTSGIKGVSWSTEIQKWKVGLRFEGKHYHLGAFNDLKKAEEIIRNARIKIHGLFARHG